MKKWFNVIWESIYETRYLTLPLSVIALICFALWLCTSNLKDFGLNAFTETLGIIITVLIVDRLIKAQEFRRSLPLRSAAYEDIRLLVTRIVGFWHKAYELSVPMATPKTIEELFTESSFEKIGCYLDLDSNSNSFPADTWWDYLPSNEIDFISRGEKILERYAGSLEPATYSLVHTVTTMQADPLTLHSLRQMDDKIGFPRPHNLGSYHVIREEFLSSVIELYNWCKAEKTLLESHGLKIKLSVPESDYFSHRDAITSPQCMFDSEKMQKHTKAIEEFRNKPDVYKTNEENT